MALPAGSLEFRSMDTPTYRLAMACCNHSFTCVPSKCFPAWLFTAVGNMHCCMALSSLMALPASKLTLVEKQP